MADAPFDDDDLLPRRAMLPTRCLEQEVQRALSVSPSLARGRHQFERATSLKSGSSSESLEGIVPGFRLSHSLRLSREMMSSPLASGRGSNPELRASPARFTGYSRHLGSNDDVSSERKVTSSQDLQVRPMTPNTLQIVNHK